MGVAQGPALPTAVSACLATIPSTPPISTEVSLGAHRGHLSPLWESALAFPSTLLTLGGVGSHLKDKGPGRFAAWGSDPGWIFWEEAPSGSFVLWAH